MALIEVSEVETATQEEQQEAIARQVMRQAIAQGPPGTIPLVRRG
jgi:hypothetical protein